MSIFNSNSLNNNHQLISREQNYTIECKKLSIHSEDRDINMWPNADEFEITCPQSYNNVQSLSLAQICLPDIFYNFSEELENTKMFYSSGYGEGSPIYFLQVPNGSYSYNNLANFLQYQMSKKLSSLKVKYSTLKNKFVFYSDADFALNFDKDISYNNCSKNKKNIPYSNINWGLSYFLGFRKELYASYPFAPIYEETLDYILNRDFGETSGNDIMGYFGISDLSENNNYKFISSEFPIPSAFYKNTIYMELNKMNNMDELKPYINNTTSLCNYDYNGMINNSFAKIIYKNMCNTCQDNIKWETLYDNKNDKAIITFDPPLEKLSKIKIKFRYHDGTPVNFLNNEINLTLEMVLLKNEIARAYNIRVPPVYTF